MKRFVMQNEKEAVIVQGKDLRFLDSQARTPKSIKKLITFEHIDVNNQEKEFIFYEKEFVHYMKNADFILNKDDFHNVSAPSLPNDILIIRCWFPLLFLGGSFI